MEYFAVQVEPDRLTPEAVEAAKDEALERVTEQFIEANGREPAGPYRVPGMCNPVEEPHVTFNGRTVRAYIVKDGITAHDE